MKTRTWIQPREKSINSIKYIIIAGRKQRKETLKKFQFISLGILNITCKFKNEKHKLINLILFKM